MESKPRAQRTSSLIWDALKTASLPILCYDLVLLRPWPFPGAEAGGAVTQILFLTIVIGGVLAGYCLTPPGRWGGLNSFAAIALPLELYSLPVLFQRSQRLALLAIGVMCASLLAFYLLIVRQSAPPQAGDRPRYPKLRHCLHYSRHVISLSLTLVLVFLALTMGMEFSSPGGVPAVARVPAGSISDHLQELAQFQEPRWSALGEQEKTTLLQLAADLETVHLGLPVSPKVTLKAMEDHATRGAYTHQTKSIEINKSFVGESTGPECLETLLHECYHSYQWTLCEVYDEVPESYRDLMVYRSVKRYRTEFANYVDDGSSEYYYQLCEMEAREYAQERLDLYLDQLTDHNLDEGAPQPQVGIGGQDPIPVE